MSTTRGTSMPWRIRGLSTEEDVFLNQGGQDLFRKSVFRDSRKQVSLSCNVKHCVTGPNSLVNYDASLEIYCNDYDVSLHHSSIVL